MLRRLLLLVPLSFVAGFSLYANNIAVTNLVLEQDADAQAITATFDIGWDNSWRVQDEPGNYDAAWLFAKYRVNGGDWAHFPLSRLQRTPTNAIQVAPNDNTGVIIYRGTSGIGRVDFTGATIRATYQQLGAAIDDIVDIRVFAIEMVYVRPGNFFLGDTEGTTSTIDAQRSVFGTFDPDNQSNFSPYEVTGEGSIDLNPSGLFYIGAGLVNERIPSTFPKGHAGFYCMKYEVSQEQFFDFFNMLTVTQQQGIASRGINFNSAPDIGYGVTTVEAGNNSQLEVTSLFPANPMLLVDGFLPMLSYLDWVGLRPMSELEYEKACRGPLDPRQGEFAWGSTQIVGGNQASRPAYTVTNPGQANALVTDPAQNVGNASWNWRGTGDFLNPILRNGVFAASAVTKNRRETGATYYGIMEMSGNLLELTVSVTTTEGRNFRRTLHGDGTLLADGRADALYWPSGSIDYSVRGGSFLSQQSDELTISSRNEQINGGFRLFGIRGVRSGL